MECEFFIDMIIDDSCSVAHSWLADTLVVILLTNPLVTGSPR